MAAQPLEVDVVVGELAKRVGDRVTTAKGVREQHGKDVFSTRCIPPDAVVFAESTEEVAEIVKLCAAHNVPLIPFGTGTALEGHFMAINGGISLDMSRMNKILRVSPEDMDVTVQAGVTRKQLNDYIKDQGLFFPIDPGADASIGGMSSTRASGTNAVRYGTMRENVLNLTVVLPDGKTIHTARRARKSSAGYDLTRLFVGAEGTLGVITEVTLRLHGIPEAISAAICSFDTLEGAVRTVIQTIQMGVPVARIELLDEVQVDSVNKYSKLGLPDKPLLMLEFHGTERGVIEQAEIVKLITEEHGGSDFDWKTRPEDRNELWKARHEAAFANLAYRPGSMAFTADVCVPISRLAECILETKKDIQESYLISPIVGHVGDGNFHVSFLIMMDDEKEWAEARRLNTRLVKRAIAMDGTCSGEHGIGINKKPYLAEEHGEAVDVMRMIKRTIDPHNIMNPGKIFDL